MTTTEARVAIVTGAAQGIGRAIALRLADDGLDVVVTDIPPKVKELDELVEEIKSRSRRGLAVTGDVTHEVDVQNLVKFTVEKLGGLDVMIANAGIGRSTPLVSTSVEEWDQLQAVNVRGVFLCYKEAAIQMIKQGRGGRIVGASSVAGKKGSPNWSSYSASKFAVRGLTQSAAAELGKYGITVNAYAPGIVDTPLCQSFCIYTCRCSRVITRGRRLVKLNLVEKPLPSYPVMQVEDIAGLVSYIVKPEAKFVTGQSMNINGGVYFD
ncbi:NAD-binding protein [Ramaria rubella]|nr:NAD-binding protein [Ramaria rubella]